MAVKKWMIFFFLWIPLAAPAEQTPPLQVSASLQKSLGIKTEKLTRRPWRETYTFSGTVIPLPQNAHEIHSPVTGRVKPGARIPMVGEEVKKGDTLAVVAQTLTAPEIFQIQTEKIAANASLVKGRNTLALREKAYERAERLYAIQAIPLKDLQIAKTEYENAKEDLSAAKRQVRFYRRRGSYLDFPIPAPISGVITALDITPGETIDPMKVLFKVENLSTVWVEVHAYENDIAKIRPGQEAAVTSPAFPGKIFHGAVRVVGMVIDPENHTLSAMVEIRNPRLLLREGMLCRVDLSGSIKASGITVPLSSLVEENGSHFVFQKEKSTLFVRRAVLIQKIAEDKAFIQEGLDPGDEIVSQGAYLLNQEWHNLQNGPSQKQKEDND